MESSLRAATGDRAGQPGCTARRSAVPATRHGALSERSPCPPRRGDRGQVAVRGSDGLENPRGTVWPERSRSRRAQWQCMASGRHGAARRVEIGQRFLTFLPLAYGVHELVYALEIWEEDAGGVTCAQVRGHMT